jgi:hypothetical protein
MERTIQVKKGIKQLLLAFRQTGLEIVDRGWDGQFTVYGSDEQFAQAWKRLGGGSSYRPWETITELHGNVKIEEEEI